MLAPRLMKNFAIEDIPLPDAVCSGVLAEREKTSAEGICEILILRAASSSQQARHRNICVRLYDNCCATIFYSCKTMRYLLILVRYFSRHFLPMPGVVKALTLSRSTPNRSPLTQSCLFSHLEHGSPKSASPPSDVALQLLNILVQYYTSTLYRTRPWLTKLVVALR